MRRSNMLWLLLAGLCSAALYHTSQRVHDGQELLASLNRETAQEEESIRVLQAEWSYLNQPQRLEALSREHLKLVPMKGDRFASIDDVAVRAAPVAAPDKDEEAPAKPAVAEKPAAVQPPVPATTAVALAQKPDPESASPVKIVAVDKKKPAAPLKPKLAEKPAAAESKAAVRQTAAVLQSPARPAPVQKVVRKPETSARDMRDVMKSLGVD